MDKVKLFSGESPDRIQAAINEWVTQFVPSIKHIHTTNYGNHGILITIVYEE